MTDCHRNLFAKMYYIHSMINIEYKLLIKFNENEDERMRGRESGKRKKSQFWYHHWFIQYL